MEKREIWRCHGCSRGSRGLLIIRFSAFAFFAGLNGSLRQ
ncbi:unnamed protein product [Amoebophrya sp. A25]|nr:unnamed protein product [Amoebophrya sp. A25]|eukprot:GSA25T00024929001.1